jgi:protocadherin-16/23
LNHFSGQPLVSGVTVLTVIATDSDMAANGTVTYSLLRSSAQREIHRLFAIDPNNGLITSVHTNAFDRERVPEYHLIVEAKDRGVPPLSGELRWTVTYV